MKGRATGTQILLLRQKHNTRDPAGTSVLPMDLSPGSVTWICHLDLPLGLSPGSAPGSVTWICPWVCHLDLPLDLSPGICHGSAPGSAPGSVTLICPWVCPLDLPPHGRGPQDPSLQQHHTPGPCCRPAGSIPAAAPHPRTLLQTCRIRPCSSTTPQDPAADPQAALAPGIPGTHAEG